LQAHPSWRVLVFVIDLRKGLTLSTSGPESAASKPLK